ncbi:DUF5133 domain-containing protein [Streptomyces sp. LP05-1]|uniref:DUF5133 domain-containing protein n=1 Tax=Streptomyces pyxinae TaxID=2970734 RepID=A0ABT2CQN4_9ACTN|nr:DUF5133 domain-containing protein [Streptomyces sp. LP05-1]MCS0639743.1 DUF5133 domain-containing protein [Streptomyces sp. LP05-1]
MAHPTVLRKLIARYEELSAKAPVGAVSAPTATAASGGPKALSPELARQLDDTAYTLCVTTGTRDVSDALRVAKRVLAERTSVPTARSGR